MNTNSINYVQMMLDAGLMVQFVLLLLLFFSIATWAIILIKARYLRKAFRESEQFVEFFWKSRDLTDAYAQAKQLPHGPIARVFRIGYVELKKLSRSGFTLGGKSDENARTRTGSLASRVVGLENVERALRRAINSEVTRMTQLVPFLATTGNTTPFIGLFGTVWGIMNSFHDIGLKGAANLAVVAPGISEALIATAAGLAAAIPAVIAYNYFMQKARFIESELQSFAADFVNIIEREILRTQGDRK